MHDEKRKNENETKNENLAQFIFFGVEFE